MSSPPPQKKKKFKLLYKFCNILIAGRAEQNNLRAGPGRRFRPGWHLYYTGHKN